MATRSESWPNQRTPQGTAHHGQVLVAAGLFLFSILWAKHCRRASRLLCARSWSILRMPKFYAIERITFALPRS